jgi:hypothetical protein
MTLSQLRALIRLTLTSVERWPDATVDAWIAAGIRLYGAHFGERGLPAIDEDVVDVPETHLEAVTAYVDFAATREMQVDEAVAGDGSSLMLGQLSEQGRRAWNRYKDVMDQLVAMSSCAAELVRWDL